MAPNYSSLHQELVSRIIAAAPKKCAAAQKDFITRFYALAPLNDLSELPPERAATLALDAGSFFNRRKGRGPAIQIREVKLTERGINVARTEIIAINDDSPFLVDSLTALLTSLGLIIHRIQHPILTTTRDASGTLKTLGEAKSARRESLIYLEVSPLPVQLTPALLEEKIRNTLAHVATAVADWQPMKDAVQALATHYAKPVPTVKPEQREEIHDFLLWLARNHFLFLGIAHYKKAKGGSLALDTKHALGIYRLPTETDAVERAATPCSADSVAILTASDVSEVHRRTNMDYIALPQHDAKGTIIGEWRMLGLFTSSVYYRETDQIPFLRRKTARVLKRAGFDKASHSGKSLKTTLEFLPRPELFQMDDESLFQMTMGIVSLEARPQVRLFVRQDPFERFVSAMVYVPRERFSTGLREEIVRTIERAYAGQFANFHTQVTESPLARVTILVRTTPGAVPEVDLAKLEHTISGLANLWAESLRDAIIGLSGEGDGEKLAATFANAFPLAYVNSHSAKAAAFDIERATEALEGDGMAVELYRRPGDAADRLHLKTFTRDLQSELSAIIPLLENMGFTVLDATPFVLTPLAPYAPVLLRDFTLRAPTIVDADFASVKARVEEAIGAVARGAADNDTLNALIASSHLSLRGVLVLRAYSRYLQQIDFPYSQPFIASALRAHAALSCQLTDLFDARFNPKTAKRAELIERHHGEISAALENITNLAEDRIIRQFLALIMATLRTNFYQTENGQRKPYLSLKLRSNQVPNMPLPVPYAEIFVTSMRMEGIHLRGGAVARGGLRWSDRPEDFRTEVLGLVKAQMVKNAVIVPQGAKGGFILRKPPVERDALMEEGIACYRLFLRGLLDITDNIAGTGIVPPADVVRHDGDDPYLVVAADKGTATFSDIANALSAEYGFWLSDAFASGGSEGYDHKAMAITARGAWVSVERHFREMEKDIGKENFTAVGIGDMSGDVFGNGMLLGKTMKLVAAFNHRHIFIDPNPDATTSYAERERLFALPRSGWTDYNAKLISKGGGVFERSAKSIKISADARAVLGTDATEATPDELIRIILKAPVDLLWNGGIGTYVKSIGESHEQVGDRANAALRINGRELRCKIVGEGGNLGFTQRGRIEYARTGGRINTDAIDNSGGVDCSDHEVNIKIALGHAIEANRLTLPKRNNLLRKMSDEVADLVLRDNRLQTQAISIAETLGHEVLDGAEQLIHQLEAEKFLNREVEFLPDNKQFAELRSARSGLTRPELAVLLAYAKMALSRDLKESNLLDANYFKDDLRFYFPKEMQKAFDADITSHRLRREIVATMITNSIVNRAGFSFAHSLMRATGLGAADIAQSYVATRDAFGLRELWAEIEALDGRVPAALQSQLFTTVNHFIEHSCRWFLVHVPQPMDLTAVMARYADGIATITREAESVMSGTLSKAYKRRVARFEEQGVPSELADRVGKLELLSSACDIIDIAAATKRSVQDVGSTYFELGAQLKLGWMRRSAFRIAADNYWQRLAVKSLIIELYQAQRRLTLDVLQNHGRKKSDPALDWVEQHNEAMQRYLSFIDELRTQPSLDYSMLIVALRQVQWIISQ